MPRDIPRPNLTEQDFEGLSSWGIRLGMASLGWTSRVFLSRSREANPSAYPSKLDVYVSFKHDAWHGTLAPVNLFRREDSVDTGDVSRTVIRILQDLGNLGREAWREWPDAVPVLMPDGSLVEHPSETEYFNRYPSPTMMRPERSCPTEALPGWPGQPSLKDFLDTPICDGDAWLSKAIQFVLYGRDAHWKDSLNPYGQMDTFNHLDRIWRFEVTPRFHRWGDLEVVQNRLASRPLEMMTLDVSALGARTVSNALKDGHRRMLIAYPPGSERLPPGILERLPPPPSVSSDENVWDTPFSPAP